MSNNIYKYKNISTLNPKQARNEIMLLKKELLLTAMQAFNIPNIKPHERYIVEEILGQELADRTGTYAKKYQVSMKNYLIILGVLYNHINDGNVSVEFPSPEPEYAIPLKPKPSFALFDSPV